MARVQTVGAQHAGPVFQSHCILRASIKAQLKTEQPIVMSMITYESHQETSITIVRSDPTSWSRFDRLWGSWVGPGWKRRQSSAVGGGTGPFLGCNRVLRPGLGPPSSRSSRSTSAGRRLWSEKPSGKSRTTGRGRLEKHPAQPNRARDHSTKTPTGIAVWARNGRPSRVQCPP